MHLLVYFLADGPGPLQDRLARLQAGPGVRNDGIVGVLDAHGMDITSTRSWTRRVAGRSGGPTWPP